MTSPIKLPIPGVAGVDTTSLPADRTIAVSDWGSPEDIIELFGSASGSDAFGTYTLVGKLSQNQPTLQIVGAYAKMYANLVAGAPASQNVQVMATVESGAASAGVQTGGTAPAFTGGVPGAAPSPTTGIHATWGAASGATPGTYTQTSGGIVAAAGALVGGYIVDASGNGGTIVGNTTCSAGGGVISVFPQAGSPATATTLVVQPPPVPSGTVASHTHTQN